MSQIQEQISTLMREANSTNDPQRLRIFADALDELSASNSAATNGTFILGTSADDDAYLTTADIGDSNVPNEFDLDNFVGAAYPHIVDGTIFVITVDYDG